MDKTREREMEQLKEQKSNKNNSKQKCVVEMEAICFNSIAGYLLRTDRITFIDSFHAVPNYVVVMCCFMFIFFFFFFFICFWSDTNRICLFEKLLQTLFRTDTVLVHRISVFFLFFSLLHLLLVIAPSRHHFIVLRIPIPQHKAQVTAKQ